MPDEDFGTVRASSGRALCLASPLFLPRTTYRRNVTTLDVDMQSSVPGWPGRGRKCASTTPSLSSRGHFPGCRKRRSTVHMLPYGVADRGPSCAAHGTARRECPGHAHAGLGEAWATRWQVAKGSSKKKSPRQGHLVPGDHDTTRWPDCTSSSSSHSTWYRQHHPSAPWRRARPATQHLMLSSPSMSRDQPNGMRGCGNLAA